MVGQHLHLHPTRPAHRRIPLLVLGIAVVGALMYFGGNASGSFQHLFYLLILGGASVYGVRGGATVGLAAAVVSSSLLPVVSNHSPPGDFGDIVVRGLSFVGVGLVTGLWTDSSRNRLQELYRLTDDSIRAFVRALDAVDGATAYHSEKVAEYSTAIAEQMNLTPTQIDRVRWAALLHDVGKISIPPEILHKQAPLTDTEWELIKRHPLESVRIVGNVTQLHSLLPAVRHHHERVDGRGYPDGVRGPQFPLEARIISVADAFDAMTSNRPYRPALSIAEAYAELRRHAGTQFDPKVVGAFIAFHSQQQKTNGANGNDERPSLRYRRDKTITETT